MQKEATGFHFRRLLPQTSYIDPLTSSTANFILSSRICIPLGVVLEIPSSALLLINTFNTMAGFSVIQLWVLELILMKLTTRSAMGPCLFIANISTVKPRN